MQCFICSTHLCRFELITEIMSEVTDSSHTDEAAAEDNTAPQWVKHAYGKRFKPLWLALHTLSNSDFHCWDEERERKKEQVQEWVKGKRWTGKKEKKSQKQLPEQRGAPVWKWWILAERTFLSVPIYLNCSLAITCCYYPIIVVNEPQQKIIRYQSVDHYVLVVSYTIKSETPNGARGCVCMCVSVPLKKS